jgi:hypothetical protein
VCRDILLQLLNWSCLQRSSYLLKTNFRLFYPFDFLLHFTAFHIEIGFRYPWRFYRWHLITNIEKLLYSTFDMYREKNTNL